MKVGEVVIGEGVRSGGVEIHHDGSVAALRACSLKGLQVCGVDALVGTARVVEVVEAIAEGSALGAPECMRTCNTMPTKLSNVLA